MARINYVWALLVGLFFLIPIGYLIVKSTDIGTDFFDALTNRQTLTSLNKTLMLAAGVSVSTTVIGVSLAWFTVRTNMYGRKILAILAPLPLAFPSYVGAVAIILGFSKGGLAEELLSNIGIHSLPSISGFWWTWLALTLFTYPYVYLPVRVFFANSSRSQEESAQLLGKSQPQIFFTIILPQAGRAISSGALLVFLYTISDFGAVALLRYNTLTVSIFSNRLANQAASISQAALLAAVGLLVVNSERLLIKRRDVAASPAAPVAGRLISLGKWRAAATSAAGVFLFLSLIGPLAVMGYWIGRGIANRGRTTGSLALHLDGLLEPMLNTIYLGLLAGFLAVVIILPVARLTVRHRSKAGYTVSSIISSSFGLPGLIIALAMVYWTLNGPGSDTLSTWLYQSLPLMIGAYIIHFGAQAIGSSETALSNIPIRVEEASRTLGAGRWRRFFSVELPLMMPTLATGAGLVMLSTMKELPITLLLSPVNFSTLATDIWGATEERALAQAGLVSLILVAISGILSWFVIFRTVKN